MILSWSFELKKIKDAGLQCEEKGLGEVESRREKKEEKIRKTWKKTKKQ